MNPVFFSFDVVKLRVSSEPHQLYSGYKYTESPLYRTLDEVKAEAIQTAKANFQVGEQTVRTLKSLTIEQLVASDTASYNVYFTNTDHSGIKADVTLTIRALASDSDTISSFYTYHLAALTVSTLPSEKRFYDTIACRHGPVYAEFQDAKAAILKLCETKRYAQLYEQVWGMSKDVTNIGKWKKSFKEDYFDIANGLQELRLNVFRMSMGNHVTSQNEHEKEQKA